MLLEAVKILRPDVTLPSRKTLRNKLLDDCYDELKYILDDKMNNVYQGILVSDGWTNIRSEPVVNYLFATSDETTFLDVLAIELLKKKMMKTVRRISYA